MADSAQITYPNACGAHMTESDRNGNCVYCGRPPNDAGGKPRRTLEIWKLGYFPFTLGGPVHRPVKTTVTVGESIDLGGGYRGYVIGEPDRGIYYVAEAQSGAIVGHNVESARADIAGGDPEFMAAQVEDGIEKRKNAESISPKRFFSH